MSQYPTILAGMRLTADLVKAMLPLNVAKTASTSRASTTSVTADPELQVAVEANAEYFFHAYIRYSGANAVGIVLGFTGPTGSTGSWGARTINSGLPTPAADSPSSAVRSPVGTPKTFETISTTSAQVIHPVGRLITGANAGTFSVDWAQEASNATPAVVEADSAVMLWRIK